MSSDGDGKRFRIGEYEIDIIVHGFPGKSVCHGSLGFSTIALVRRGAMTALVDVGSFGQRALLLEQLAQRGLQPKDISHVLLTHSHYDHAINWLLFPNAKVIIGRIELDWSLQQPWGETVVPELYMRELEQSPNLRAVSAGDEVFPGITAHMTPGHTPGSLVYVLDCGEREMVFTGDACKNRAELLSRAADMTYDAAVTRASMDAIWSFWSRRPGNILVPGHDLPMVQDNGTPRYLGQREAAIRAWYGEDLHQTTVISLLPGGERAAAE
jgi:glyoxylase-like metal-dependent hydrolase (beta-lactamase superfamily II)